MLIKYYSTQAKKFYHPNPKSVQKKRANAAVFASFTAARLPALHILCREGDETMPTNGLRYLRRVAALAAGGVLAAGLLFALRAELCRIPLLLEQGAAAGGRKYAVPCKPPPPFSAGSAAPAGVTAADKRGEM